MTYDKLEKAIEDGHAVELCSIDQHCHAVSWRQVDEISCEWDTSRYRIVKKDGEVIDGKR